MCGVKMWPNDVEEAKKLLKGMSGTPCFGDEGHKKWLKDIIKLVDAADAADIDSVSIGSNRELAKSLKKLAVIVGFLVDQSHHH